MLRSPGHILWGAVVGLAVASGWVGTYWIFDTGFGLEPIESHTFAGPIADTIFYGMTASGNAVSFSVGSVTGVIIGAFLGSATRKMAARNRVRRNGSSSETARSARGRFQELRG